ncbi:hypothetical protein GC207_06315 [bacterium]|nr:hypothetical protein [bacterium]
MNPVKPTSARSQIAAISRRLIITATILTITAAIAIVTVSWAHYRFGHVVIRNAQVKGVVTRVGARMDGQIRSVLVEPGQLVHSNDVLVVLENRYLQASLERMTAEHAAAVADYQAAQLALEQQRRILTLGVEEANSQITTSQAEIEAADSDLAKINAEFERVTSLKQSGISSASALDGLTSDRNHAQAVLEAKKAAKNSALIRRQRAEADLAGLKVNEAQLGVLEARVKVAASSMDEVKADLESTYVRAPGDGWVIDRIIEVGGSAKVGEPMIAMWLGDPWIEALVPENSLRDVSIGSAVEVEIVAYPDLNLKGTVDGFGVLTDKAALLPQAAAATSSLFSDPARVPVKISLRRTPKNLQPGLTALVGIEVPERRKTRVAGVVNRAFAWIEQPFLARASSTPEPEMK